MNKSDFYNYLNKADGSSPRYNLARLLVLQDSGVSKELMSQAVENENKYELIYFLIKNEVNENEINDLFLGHDSPHDIDEKNCIGMLILYCKKRRYYKI